MDFDRADERKMTHAASRERGQGVIATRVHEIEVMGEYLFGTIDRMAERAMMGIAFSQE